MTWLSVWMPQPATQWEWNQRQENEKDWQLIILREVLKEH